jgi:hypothetical protein
MGIGVSGRPTLGITADPRGQTAYGVPIRVFTPADIDAMIALAERHGFRLTGPLDTVCDERWSVSSRN